MSERSTPRSSASRPGDAESWIKASEPPIRRGITVADMLRDLLADEFPADPGEPS
jgi:hypothetical protein